MFKKILIANRGEIACRISKTAHKMGIRTVAVYADADARALHVKMADEAVHIGLSIVAESYLCGDKIIAAAVETGAEAIHPGYGFLSENPDFVEAVEAAGLVFIGPSVASIRAMGLKDAAKLLMKKAGVPVVPGYHGPNQDPTLLAAEAEKIGYPVFIKARAGGGGKGMRKVEKPEDFASLLQGAQREGQASFGDAHVLIEKYISAPRHIEVQVFGDNHGNAVHLFERDCSLQRRHQKVIEEAPAPGMTEKMRAAMTEAAVTAAKATNYSGAGTVEFIVDGSGPLAPDRFWFMEMNTRLQVEHPVTEAITGQDLVEWQIRVAAGDPLPLTQSQLAIKGHAFEARLYAEDAANGFLPVTGKLNHLKFGDARIDSGVVAGDSITPFYDPMIAKLTIHGESRSEALSKMRQALANTHVAGTVTNIGFLSALCAHEGFSRGEVNTGLIERDLHDLIARPDLPEIALAFAAIAALNLDLNADHFGWRLWGSAHHQVFLNNDGLVQQRTLVIDQNSRIALVGEGTKVRLDNTETDGSHFAAWVEGKKCTAQLARFTNSSGLKCVSVLMDGHTWAFETVDPLAEPESSSGSDADIVAPMSGTVLSVSAQVGASVRLGDQLVIIEAMKMEHTLVAPRDAVIAEVSCVVGNAVEDGVVLVRLKAEEGD